MAGGIRLGSTVTTANSSALQADYEFICACLPRVFPEQIGHLLVSHLPDQGARMLSNDIRVSVSLTSALRQKCSAQSEEQFFVSMSINQNTEGKYFIEKLHPIKELTLYPTFERKIVKIYEKSEISKPLFIQIKPELETQLKESNPEFSRYSIFEYDKNNCTLSVYGERRFYHQIQNIANRILENALKSLLEEEKIIECAGLQVTLQSGLVVKSLERSKHYRRPTRREGTESAENIGFDIEPERERTYVTRIGNYCNWATRIQITVPSGTSVEEVNRIVSNPTCKITPLDRSGNMNSVPPIEIKNWPINKDKFDREYVGSYKISK